MAGNRSRKSGYGVNRHRGSIPPLSAKKRKRLKLFDTRSASCYEWHRTAWQRPSL